MMNSVLFFAASFVLKMTVSQTFSHTPLLGEGNSLTVQCSTTDFNGTVYFRLGTDDKGLCLIGNDGLCYSGIDGYNTPTRQDTTITKMTIASCNETRDTGNWTCTYDALTSPPVEISSCSVVTQILTDNGNGDGKNIYIGIGIPAGCLVIAFIIVIVMIAIRLNNLSTEETYCVCFIAFCLFIAIKLFDCCGNKNSKINWFLGYWYLVLCGVIVDVIVLLAVYYGFVEFKEGVVIGVGCGIVLVLSGLCLLVVWMLKKFFNNDASERSRSQRSESCISLKNGTVTPHERQQPDGHEGPQSTPKDPDPRHLTTGRPLPRRPDIASPQTGPFDSVNSPRPIVLAPIENPNIPPSIDTLDEQKTDKKPKDKKKKKKKMKDEEQDNPAYVQDN